MMESTRNLEKCGQKLQVSLDLALQWGRKNGVQFQNIKIEIQYFHQKRKYTEPPLLVEWNKIIPDKYTRWLGIILDRKLSFKERMRRACAGSASNAGS